MTPSLPGCDLDTYRCSKCKVHGVRLFRQYQTVVDAIALHCQACALLDQQMDAPDNEEGSTIGWLVAAIPSPDQSFWGYTSAPPEACAWWFALPVRTA